MKKRKSFLLHIDSLDILDDLDNDQVANLFRAIKAYQNGDCFELDAITKIAFMPFKNQFERDNEKYQETCKRRAEAGSKGGIAKVANASKSKQKVANLADSDNKNKNKSDSESDSKENNIYQQIADAWNAKFKNELPTVKTITQKRKSAISGCIKQMKGTQHDFSKIETWSNLFDYAGGLDFLMGRKTDWSMDFDFIITKSKLLKIVEGGYEN